MQICWGSDEKLSSLKKMSFLRRKNTKRWMQQASNSNINPINILSSQKHLSTYMQSIQDPKHTHTHTHTQSKSNQFYISKIS